MAGTWVDHYPLNDLPHLIPIGDLIGHMAHTDCICWPALVDNEWVHHALDGRTP